MGWGKERAQKIFVPYWTRSYELYKQPHALWLTGDSEVGVNLGPLNQILTAAEAAQQAPELVIYAIPRRDLGQSSEGGFRTYEAYMAENRLMAEAIGRFVQRTGLVPRVYLEPDALSLAVENRRSQQGSPESIAVYNERVAVFPKLIRMYREAGAMVYLDAAHSGWFDYGDADVMLMASALNDAGVAQAQGVVSNVSNRQKLKDGENQSEWHYLRRLLPVLNNGNLDVVVDTSRNGGETRARLYYMAPNGNLIDNELPKGRLVGAWRKETDPETGREEYYVNPFWGPQKPVSRLVKFEKYEFNPERMLLKAPPWLDPVGDVKLGVPPTDEAPGTVKPYVQRLRYIKPPDDCDGSVNCPPGESKHDIHVQTMRMQPGGVLVDGSVWEMPKPEGGQ